MSGLPSPNMASLAAMGQGMPNGVVNSQAIYGNSMNPNVGKKAVHVKWAGKTIALGTFPHVEADEKCARAKALTRAWRSTMRPKPTREWVMLELERLQVRVVSGRIGRKGEDDDDDDDDDDDEDGNEKHNIKHENGAMNDSQLGTNGLMNSAGMSGGVSGENGGLNKKNGDMRDESPSENGMPPHRPLVGGGSAAAYEAARADHYRNVAELNAKKKNKGAEGSSSKDNPNDITNPMPGPLSQMKSKTGVLGQSPVAMPQLGLTVNPNQHYEMLKLHHMNLLNEIQETTLMMNLYQQQQLQQQQQLTDQQPVPGPSADQQLALQLAQQQQSSSASPFLESLYTMNSANAMNPSQQFPFMNQQASQFQQQLQQSNNQFGLGFGGSGGMGSANHQMHALLRQQQNMLTGGMNGMGMQNTQLKSKIDEEVLNGLKQDLSDRQRLENMDKNGGGNSKRNYPPQDYGGAKKQKKNK